MNNPKRALTDDDKRAVIDRIYHAWLQMPELRLCQMIACTIQTPAPSSQQPDIFYVEDYSLAEKLEKFVSQHLSDKDNE